MHTKVAYASTEDLGLSVVDPCDGVKTAGFLPEVSRFFDTLVPDPAYLYTHLNAMGRSEFYGANANSDWYGYNKHLDFDGLMHVPEDFGIDPARDAVRCKQLPYGFPSFYNATFFAHHKNTDPKALGFGDVVFVAHNPGMKRIELVTRISKAEARAKGQGYLLDRIRRGDRVEVSMGCKVPFDLCSVCTDWAALKEARALYNPKTMIHWGVAALLYHRKVKPIRGLAPKPEDWCSCMKTMRNKVLPSGLKVFVYNDLPRFFDISAVLIGADRTACVMFFQDTPDHDQPTSSSIPEPQDHRLDALKILGLGLKTASDAGIEKEIPEGFIDGVLRCDEQSDISPALQALQPELEVPQILSSLASAGILLRPREFQRVVLTSAGKDPDAKEFAGKVFGPSDEVDDSLALSPEKPAFEKLMGMLAPMRSSHPVHLRIRLGRHRLSPRFDLPDLEEDSSPVMQKIAALYNGYRLSAMEKAPEILDHELNRADLMTVKAAGFGTTAAVLATAPMVHWVASNLREKEQQGQQLGMLSGFMAHNPTTSSVLLIGAALRARMALKRREQEGKPSGLRGALKDVLNNAASAL